LANTLAEQKIDVVYDRLFHMTMVTGPATKRARVRRVSTIVSPPEFDVVRSEKRWLRWKKESLRRSYLNADALLAVGSGTADSASEFYGIQRDRFQVASSPVDVERIDRDSNLAWEGIPLRSDRKQIVAIGRLSDEKGHRFLIQAVAQYQREALLDFAPPVDLHLVGDGVLRRELQSLAESLGLGDSVFFHGHLSNPFPLLKRCDLMVLPSFYEGMPNVLLEAMLCRVPILATNTEQGAGELLRKHPLGSLVAKGNASEMANAIRHRFQHPSQWLERLDTAREHVIKHHSMEQWISQMSLIFEKVCSH
jgi:glycosyltransferase involved in cell wall biosynthesis